MKNLLLVLALFLFVSAKSEAYDYTRPKINVEESLIKAIKDLQARLERL